MKVKFTLGIGFAGVHQEEEVEFDDELTEDEIYAELDEWKYQYIDAGYEILEKPDERSS